jgi:hypothetical protein
MAPLLRAFGDTQRADKLKKDALDLARRFEKNMVSSNPGRLLFTRIVSRERGRAIVGRMMHDDMFSGWECADAIGGRARLQPAQLSPRLGVAARQILSSPMAWHCRNSARPRSAH